jgi:copper(I)-binding protein
MRGLLLLTLLAALTLGSTSCAPSPTPSGIVISDAWARPAPDAGSATAVYLRMTNTAASPDRLLGGASPLAEAVEVHQTMMEGDMMHMVPISGIDLAPGTTVALEPGALHLMLIGLSDALQPGDRVPVTLRFEQAGAVEVEAEVREP